MAEVQEIADEIERLQKVEKGFEQYRETVRKIISDRIKEIKEACGEKGGICTYVTVSTLRAILLKIERI